MITGISSYEKKKSDDRSLKVGNAIGRAISDSIYLSASAIYEEFNKLEFELIEIGEGGNEQVEIQRRVAEAKVSLLFKHKESVEVFNKAWSDLLTVGFSSAEREASMRFYYIKFLLANGVRKSEIKKEISQIGWLIDNKFGESEFSQKQHFINVKMQLEVEFERTFNAT